MGMDADGVTFTSLNDILFSYFRPEKPSAIFFYNFLVVTLHSPHIDLSFYPVGQGKAISVCTGVYGLYF
jgi:hypothetical protein